MKTLQILLVTVVILVSFQNCGQPGALSVSESGSLLGPVNTPTGVSPPATDFSCRTVVLLPYSTNLNIPTRTSDGICYAVKLFSAIANDRSELTKDKDVEVIARDHKDLSIFALGNPYVMGKAAFNLQLIGQRKVKLSGGPSSSKPILIDNFVMVGIYPLGTVDNLETYYAAYGTRDSSAYANKDFIEFKNKDVPLIPFANSQTATVAPLEIVNDLQANQSYTIDIRALDCGGSRELSDIYVLFQ